MENTQQDYLITNSSIYLPGRSATFNFSDLLPSLHLKYSLSQKENLRFSYFKSISRPGFGDIIPAKFPQDYGAYDLIGNPLLQHTVANNFDLRYELFPGHSQQFLVGAFYKHLQNPIEYYVTSDGSVSGLEIIPQNPSKPATNYGLEAVFTKYFGKFGINANYTYTNSSVTTTKLEYIRTPAQQNTTITKSQTRPLQGQADHIGNLSLIYKDPKLDLDAQLAFQYTGDYIVQVSPYYNQDYWQKASGQLDFSMEKRIAKRFAIYCKLNNLLNTIHKEYLKYTVSQTSEGNGNVTIPLQDGNNKITIVQRDMFKTSILVGVKFKF